MSENKDENRGKGYQNIVPYQFKPGESGNPKGRPKGKRNFDTLVDLAIQGLAAEVVRQHNKKARNKKNQITLEDIDIENDIFMQLLNKARRGDQKAIDSYLDRRFGKAVQPFREEEDPDNELYKKKLELADKEIDAWQKMWGVSGDDTPVKPKAKSKAKPKPKTATKKKTVKKTTKTNGNSRTKQGAKEKNKK